jgi:Holliday junction resolvasome RuvABC endonuclease subunit
MLMVHECSQLICTLDEYDASRPPRNECGACWAKYNARWDLPEGNTLARSSKELAERLWISRRIPEMRLAYDEHPRNVMLFLEERAAAWRPISIGIDASLSQTAVAVIAESGGEIVCAFGCYGIDLPQDASAVITTRRLDLVSDFVADFYVEALGRHTGCPVAIEDHAYTRNTNRATQVHELHGAIKKEIVRRTGQTVVPVGISQARSAVFHHGKPKGGKPALKKALSLRFPWATSLNHDEVDAWAVAAHHFTTQG